MLERLNEDPRFQCIDRYTQKIELAGGLVRLSGRVRTRVLKQGAAELALGTPGVVSVDNHLIADDELAEQVERAMRDAGLGIQNLEVSPLLGRVTLRGVAATPAMRTSAELLARGVSGVASVVNELELQDAQAIAGCLDAPVR